jgi:hypothetical protein
MLRARSVKIMVKAELINGTFVQQFPLYGGGKWPSLLSPEKAIARSDEGLGDDNLMEL